MADEQDLYAILEVDRSADDEALRLAYRRLAWRYHPDVAGPDALAKMQVINSAYQTLSDAERRRAYDAGLRPEAGAQPARRPSAPREHRPRAGLRALNDAPFTLLRRFSGLDSSPVAAIAFTHDGALCGLGQLDGRLTIVSMREGDVVSALAFGAHERVGTLQALEALLDVVGQQLQRSHVERCAQFFDFVRIDLHAEPIARALSRIQQKA